MRKALLNAPIDVFRGLDRWRDPIVAENCRVVSKDIGTFRVRANSDDLWHVVPTREPAIIGTIRGLLHPGDCFIDAGANIGVYSVLASRLVGPNGRVIAIEMMPDTAAILRAHLAENGCDNAMVVEAALSDRAGETVTAQVSEGKFGQASIATGHGEKSVEVDTTTLTDVVSGYGRVRLIKMDLEGAEMNALKGAEPVLDRIDAILFEDWGDDKLTLYLESKGFRVERLDGRNSLAARS